MSMEIDQALERATEALERNDLENVEAECKAILKEEQFNAPARLLLGYRAIRLRRPDIAEAEFRKAVRNDPMSEKAAFALAGLLRDKGEFTEALQMGEKASKTWPDDVEWPNFVASCNFSLGRYAETDLWLEKAFEIDPEHAPSRHAKGVLCQMLDKFEEAEQNFRRALAAAPDRTECYLGLARCLVRRQRYAEAVEIAEKGMEIDPNSASVAAPLIRALTGVGRTEEAGVRWRAAVRRNPGLLASYGFWLQETGDTQGALSILVQAIQTAPVQGLAYYGLVQAMHAEELDRPFMRKLHALVDERMGLQERSYLHYALGAAHEKLGEYEEAMKQYDAANAIGLQLLAPPLRFKGERYRRDAEEIIQAFTPEFMKAHQKQGSPSELPVFIVGMIRSGTSLTEQILSSHPSIGGVGERRYWIDKGAEIMAAGPENLTPDAIKGMAEEFLELLRASAPGNTRVTEKMPLNSMWLGLITLAFPKARIIHVKRHPVDTCLSVYASLLNPPPDYSHEKASIVAAYRQYRELMDHWLEVLPPGRVFEVSYEDLVGRNEETVRAMVEHCGVPWEGACLHPEANKRAISTPSLWQARKPIFDSSVERWRRFEPWLGELRELLSEP